MPKSFILFVFLHNLHVLHGKKNQDQWPNLEPSPRNQPFPFIKTDGFNIDLCFSGYLAYLEFVYFVSS